MAALASAAKRIYHVVSVASLFDWLRGLAAGWIGAALVAGGGYLLHIPTFFLVCLGIVVFLVVGLMVLGWLERRAGALGRLEDLFSLLEAWAKPAFQAATTLVNKTRTTESVSEDLAVLCQKALDEANAAYSAAANAIVNRDGSAPERAFGRLYRGYQGLSTYIARGVAQGALDTNELWYREWRDADKRFLTELRGAVGRRQFETLRQEVYAVGWGEGVRNELAGGSF